MSVMSGAFNIVNNTIQIEHGLEETPWIELQTEKVDYMYTFSDNSEQDGNYTEDAKFEEFYKQSRFITGLICYPIVCTFGLIGNVISVIVLSQKKLRTSTNIYLICLAISDGIKLLNDFLYFWTVLFFHVKPPIGELMYGYLYPYAHFIMNWSTFTTAWLTVSVGVERYIFVCYATRAKIWCSKFRSCVISMAVFIIMFALAIPFGMRYQTIHNSQNGTLDVVVTELWKVDVFVVTYTWIQTLLRSIVPLIILVTLNACIITALWKSHKASKRRLSKNNRITTTLIFVVLMFTVCVTPDAIMSLFMGFGYLDATFLGRGIREITDLLLAVNSACNFILYYTFNRVFRKHFIQLFTCIKRGERRLSGKSETVLNMTPQPSGFHYLKKAFPSFFHSSMVTSVAVTKVPLGSQQGVIL
ncbi:unnamed protein product [Owenia fusiformis]|uniref:G-protein coupled receptors family 1 profile domain-containing protein n=1 Tax=Owenia fusiformis TaxID=6347 RepID=A0A8S4N0Z4_OWEFU|nr:unnamed protein product [Owenia fusiformis]